MCEVQTVRARIDAQSDSAAEIAAWRSFRGLAWKLQVQQILEPGYFAEWLNRCSENWKISDKFLQNIALNFDLQC